jgi:hypothetical protein
VTVTVIDDARGLADADPGVDEQHPPELQLMAGGSSEDALGPVADTVEFPPEPGPEPGLGDMEAAVALVSAGLATRVVLTGFLSWPGLLWHAYRLAEAADVLILPTVVRPGGRVDIVITRDSSTNG